MKKKKKKLNDLDFMRSEISAKPVLDAAKKLAGIVLPTEEQKVDRATERLDKHLVLIKKRLRLKKLKEKYEKELEELEG